MDLNLAAVIFMGGYVVVIVAAGLILSLRPGAGVTPLDAIDGVVGGCGRVIVLGGDVEALGNFRGNVRAVELAPTGRLVAIMLGSGGGLIEGGRVPASAILSSDGQVLQISEPSAEPPSDGSANLITLQPNAAVVSLEGKRLGRLRMICVDRGAGLVTGLIAAGGARHGRTVRVPIGRVKAAGPERVVTNLRADEWASLQDFATDQAIRQAVLQRLAEDPATEPFVRSLTVLVEDQRVMLGGYVRTPTESEQAAAVARSVPGVVAVERATRTDEDLVRAVRDAISRDLGASANSLDVRSEFGQIDILGRVRDRQALRRIEAAVKAVPGVLVMHNFATVG
ncbi:MAG: BON domain-containing protein [Candidatus Dormibacteraeota bacterium]|nr:BON domain-containing protein [Candidatus Dormibacteraeota bacterium]